MRQNDPFFFVEDSLNDRFDEIEHSDYLMHFSLFKSKSKYKGGFKKGKNTKEYNHDYYIHNKDKWKKEGMTEDELKELGFTDEEIAAFEFERDAKGALIIPTSWVQNFLKTGAAAAASLIDSFANTLLSFFKKGDDNNEDEPKSNLSFNYDIKPKEPEKTDGYEDPKTLDDPQRIVDYEYEIEDQTGRNTETVTTNFDYIPWLEGTKLKDGPSSVKEDCAAVNPHYGEEAGYGINCAWCTTAYDLRRRGYDVEAPSVTHGMTFAEETQLYKDTTMADWKTPHNNEELFEQIAEEGNGARGRLSVLWNDGTGGHAMAWEVVNNIPYVIDCQSNDIYDEASFELIARYIDFSRDDRYGEDYSVVSSGCRWLRTDNRELNMSGKINEEFDYNSSDENQKADNWTEDIKDGKITLKYTPGSNNIVDISNMFVSKPTDERSNQLWKDISTKLKHGRLKSKKKSNAKRKT